MLSQWQTFLANQQRMGVRSPKLVCTDIQPYGSTQAPERDDMAEIAAQINKVYQQADYVGSLVVNRPAGRPTEYEGAHVQPPDWWDVFWQRHLAHSGQSREEAIAMLKKLLGDRWEAASLKQAEEALGQAER